MASTIYACTTEFRNLCPYFVYASIGKKWRGALIVRGILTFLCGDHYQPVNATRVACMIPVPGCLMGMQNSRKRKSNQGIMTQKASLVLYLFGLWTLFLHFPVRGGGFICNIKLPMQEIELNVQGHSCAGRG